MTIAKRVFFVAGVLGLLMLLPMYFAEGYIGENSPPAITHPEFFYGFVGVGLAWQIVFLIIARDPLRYRPLMLPSMVEKFSFSGAVYVLFALSRVPADLVAVASIDFTLGILFVWSYIATGREQAKEASADREHVTSR